MCSSGRSESARCSAITWHEPQNSRFFVASKPCTLPATAAPMGNTPSPSSSQTFVARVQRRAQTR